MEQCLVIRVCLQEGFSHCASEACSFLLSLPGLDSVVGRRLVEYLAKSVSRALESQVPAANKHPAAAAQMATAAAPTAAATAGAITCGNSGDSGDDSNGAEAAARGHTPTSSNPTPTPPVAAAAPPCPVQQAAVDFPPQKPVALTASNRSPHTVVRPKPTRPAFGRSSSSSPQSHDVAAAAVAAAQRDPMWRPW